MYSRDHHVGSARLLNASLLQAAMPATSYSPAGLATNPQSNQKVGGSEFSLFT